MKKFILSSIIATLILTNFISPCEKVVAAGVRYWICGKCNVKTKSLDGYVPVEEDRDIFGRRTGHYHDWREVDYRTWINW